MADILIVEDDIDLTETYADWLEARGHSVIYASNIREAASLFTEMQPAIITLDLNLPGNSSSVLNTFIHSAKLLNRTKVIIISGHPEIMSGQAWMDEVDLVLTKPVENQDLLTMIDRLLSLQDLSTGHV
jgi:DNA-binding NtrC family response regulator